MEFGLGLMGYDGCWDDAAFAERHGFTTAGFVDSPLIAGDIYVCMALAASTTTNMRLGTFIAVPGNRTAPTTAAAIATINRLAPGRTFLALGTGFTGRNTFGLPPVSVKAFRQFAVECKELLAGEETMHVSAEGTHPIRFGHPDYSAVSLKPAIPVYMAAEGPKTIAATAEVADGWVTGVQNADTMENIAQAFAEANSTLETAAARVGRDFSDSYKIWGTGICVLEPGESAVSKRALERVGPMAMNIFHAYADKPATAEHLPDMVRDRLTIYEEKVLGRFDVPDDRRYQKTHLGHLSYLLEGESEVLTEEIVRNMTLTGTAEEIAERLRELESLGVSNVSFYTPPSVVRETVVDVQEKIMPLL